MDEIKVLYVFQEILPYVAESEGSLLGRKLPQKIQEKGAEIRTFMPRYGIINERKNQLHEVIRLSGMNVVINDTDNPLIIKVASIPMARMQVYFIDNEDYFKGLGILSNEKKEGYPNNDERAIFFTKGILETVKKLRWTPNIIHLSGWMSHLLPIYIKNLYKDDPYYGDAKIIYSVANDTFSGNLSKNFASKLADDNLPESIIDEIKNSNYLSTTELALKHVDAITHFTSEKTPEIDKIVKKLNLPAMPYISDEDENLGNSYYDFYKKILSTVDA
jgi:starch synthase